MTFLLDMLDIVEPGYHAPQARHVEAPTYRMATDAAPREPRKADPAVVDDPLCIVCGVREPFGSAGVCTRRCCREVVETSE